MKLVFIRHSKPIVDAHVPIDSWGLSHDGILAAEKLQKNKIVQSIQIVYASLQPKALETAILATKNFGVYIRTDDRLTEITSFTKKFVELDVLEKNVKDFYSGRVERLNNGESKDEALRRFHQALEEIVEREKDKETIGIVSHGAILSFFAAQYVNQDPHQLLEHIKQPDIAVFDWNTKQFSSLFGENF